MGRCPTSFSSFITTTTNLSWDKGEDAEKSNDTDEEEEVVEINAEVSCTMASELHSAIDVIRRYSFFSSTGSQDLRDMGENLEKPVHANRKSNMKQIKSTNSLRKCKINTFSFHKRNLK